MFIAKITHPPFDAPFICEENCTEVTTITSEGLTYSQFTSLLGDSIILFGFVKVEITFKTDEPQNNNFNH